MTSYQYRKSHCGDKTILRPSYLHNGISYTGKTTSLYWIGVLVVNASSGFNVIRLNIQKSCVEAGPLNQYMHQWKWLWNCPYLTTCIFTIKGYSFIEVLLVLKHQQKQRQSYIIIPNDFLDMHKIAISSSDTMVLNICCIIGSFLPKGRISAAGTVSVLRFFKCQYITTLSVYVFWE